jgi:hypothetical protein
MMGNASGYSDASALSVDRLSGFAPATAVRRANASADRRQAAGRVRRRDAFTDKLPSPVGRGAVLGRMPGKSRATALGPDGLWLGPSNHTVKQPTEKCLG